MQGLLKRDSTLCNIAIADDEEVDVLEKQIDKEGIEIMIRFHPVASDMRQVISTMKLERQPGKNSRSICGDCSAGEKIESAPAVPEVFLLEPIYREAHGHLPR